MDNLEFSYRFPYSEKSKSFLKEENVDINQIPENVVKRAAILISKANMNKEYEIDLLSTSKELLKIEVMAFPTAKMLLSNMKIPNLSEKFANLIAKKTFSHIVEGENPKEISLELAGDFNLKYALSENEFVEIALLDYLDIYFIYEETKLVNKSVLNGTVFLNVNDFARFLSEKAYKKIVDSLPIPKEKIPKELIKVSKNLEPQLGAIQEKTFTLKLSGKVDPLLFPPSIKKIYEKGLAGQKLTHFENLTIGGFLRQVGMSKEQVVSFFSKAPNYKKQLADYQINRIFEQEISAPGYVKMSEYGILVDPVEKKYKHPFQYYKSKLIISNRIKNNKGGEKNVS